VELEKLTEKDFRQILVGPRNSLTEQARQLLATEQVEVVFMEDGLDELAQFAHRVNEETENIGARRLHTILDRLLEDLSFRAPDLPADQVLCEKCKLWVEEQNARAAAERRVDALFARGHKFDAGERFPFFYKPSLSGSSLDVVLRAFRLAAVNAVLAGMSDAEVTEAAEEAARVSASILRERSH
jgi:hypothetical protein